MTSGDLLCVGCLLNWQFNSRILNTEGSTHFQGKSTADAYVHDKHPTVSFSSTWDLGQLSEGFLGNLTSHAGTPGDLGWPPVWGTSLDVELLPPALQPGVPNHWATPLIDIWIIMQGPQTSELSIKYGCWLHRLTEGQLTQPKGAGKLW